MIICPNCARENESHYKFCLGCGTELSKSAAKAAAAEPRPAAAEAATPRPVATALPQAAPRAGGRAPAPAPNVSAVIARLAAADAPAPAAPAPVAVAMATPVAPSVPVAVAAVVAEPQTDEIAPEAPASEELGPPFDEGAGMLPTLAVSVEEVRAALADSQAAELAASSLEAGGELLQTNPGVEAVSTSAPPDEAAPPVADDPDLPFDVSGAGEPLPAADAAVGGAAELPDPLADGDAHGAPAALDAHLCRSCGAVVPPGFRFCGVCGSRYEPAEAPAAAMFVPHLGAGETAPARLIVIHPDGSEGETFPLGPSETLVGRLHPSPLFADDPFLSPRHATFYFVKNQLFVRDEASLNGVFLRIKAEVELFHGDMFRIGQQLLMFEEMRQVRPVLPGAGDGTTVMGSPARGAWGRVSSVVAVGTSAAVWTLRRPVEAFGRERGDILFPEDGFVSGAHCRLHQRDGRFFLLDLGSTNGTYLRVKGEGILARGDLLLLGQQLFRIDLRH